MSEEWLTDRNEVFLQPGDFYFGATPGRVRTLLGSCVAITLWHPRHQWGGMCHYLLPDRPEAGRPPFDGRYADGAIALFLDELRRTRTQPGEYQVKVFGGGNMFPGHHRRDHVGTSNVSAARRLLDQHGFKLLAEDVGGVGHRIVVFELWSGHVWVRRHEPMGFVGMAEARAPWPL